MRHRKISPGRVGRSHCAPANQTSTNGERQVAVGPREGGGSAAVGGGRRVSCPDPVSAVAQCRGVEWAAAPSSAGLATVLCPNDVLGAEAGGGHAGVEDVDGAGSRPRRKRNSDAVNFPNLGQEYWHEVAQETLKKHLSKKFNTNVAKNVIFFLGDGMSMQTITAARIYQGQLDGRQGEEDYLSFELFPFVGLAKTYCVDSQVADSACSATAYLGGVKGNEGTIGVSGRVEKYNCLASQEYGNRVSSIAQWAQEAGKSTGFVTTARVTHATPAGLYAHVANRGWEDDVGVLRDGQNLTNCPDIAQQLMCENPGKDFNVIMGGGRRNFYPQDITDAEGIRGKRRDRRNLIEFWQNDKISRESSYAYVTTRNQLLELEEIPDYLLGLFSPNHMAYGLDGSPTEPSLEEMTEAAVKVLQKNPRGFFLFVEGGRIDMAHHDNMAKKALHETVGFSRAIARALNMTDEEDTLVVVSADHSHVMSISGYAKKGNKILGFAGVGLDGLPYSTLSYANGPGYLTRDFYEKMFDVRQLDTEDDSFKFPAMTPLLKETHGADDVAVYATGPWSHLFSGSYEQNFIPHALGFAACLGKGLTICQSRDFNEEARERAEREPARSPPS